MKFMVCYDSSDLSKHVVKEAQKHAKVWGASLEVVQVLKREDPIEHSKLLVIEEKFGTEIQSLFEDADIPYNIQLIVDDIDEDDRVIELAKRKKIDLIFIGLKKRSKVGKILFGSTAQLIILKATCPVVTITRLAVD